MSLGVEGPTIRIAGKICRWLALFRTLFRILECIRVPWKNAEAMVTKEGLEGKKGENDVSVNDRGFS